MNWLGRLFVWTAAINLTGRSERYRLVELEKMRREYTILIAAQYKENFPLTLTRREFTKNISDIMRNKNHTFTKFYEVCSKHQQKIELESVMYDIRQQELDGAFSWDFGVGYEPLDWYIITKNRKGHLIVNIKKYHGI